jgi:predicted nucleic acid-binding OB-fold protein
MEINKIARRIQFNSVSGIDKEDLAEKLGDWVRVNETLFVMSIDVKGTHNPNSRGCSALIVFTDGIEE